MNQVLEFLNSPGVQHYVVLATVALLFAARVLSKSEAPTLWALLPAWCDITTWPRLAQPIVPFVLAGGPIVVAGFASDGIDASELAAAFWAGVEATGVYHLVKKAVPASKVAGTVVAATLLLLVSGCAGSFEESRLAGLNPQARASAPPQTERCRSLDDQHRWLGGVAKGSAFLAGASGIATWPVDNERAELGLAIGAGVMGATAVTAEYLSSEAESAWVRECNP